MLVSDRLHDVVQAGDIPDVDLSVVQSCTEIAFSAFLDTLEVGRALIRWQAVEGVYSSTSFEESGGYEESETASGARDEDDSVREVEFREHGAGSRGGASKCRGGLGALFNWFLGYTGCVTLQQRGEHARPKEWCVSGSEYGGGKRVGAAEDRQ